MRYFLFIFMFFQNLFAEDILPQNQTPFSVEFAYLRKQHPTLDKGTVHLFLKNTSKIQSRIVTVRINDEEVSAIPNERFVWKQVLPNPVEPGKTMDVMVKLAESPKKLIKVEVSDEEGNLYSRVIQPIPVPLSVTHIAFYDDYSKIRVWVENRSEESVSMDSLCLDTTKLLEFSPPCVLTPQVKKFFDVSLSTPLRQGEYVSVKLLHDSEVLSEALIRVFSYFPISSWDGDTRQEFGFDPEFFLMNAPKENEKFESLKKEPPFKIYHLYDDPACEDERKKLPLGGHAEKIMKIADRCRAHDPVHLTTLYLCEYQKPLNYFVYGELADVMMVTPYEVAYYGNPPEKDGEVFRLAKLASEPRLCYAIVEAFRDNNPKRSVHRFPTPEEEIKIVESLLQNGAKGLIYFNRKHEGGGYDDNPPLLETLGKINREVQKKKSQILLADEYTESLF